MRVGGLCRCVCVNHLNRCKTSNLWLLCFFGFDFQFNLQGMVWFSVQFAGGRSVMVSLLPTKTLLPSTVMPDLANLAYLHCCDYLLFRVCCHWILSLQSVRVNGNPLSPEPERRQFWISSISAASTFSVRFSQSDGLNNFLAISATLAMAMVASCMSAGHFTDPFLSGVTEMFLHLKCIPQQNSQWQFWASVLLTSVRQDAVSPSGNTFPGRMLDPSTWSLNLQI